jgi:hypothetical protein
MKKSGTRAGTIEKTLKFLTILYLKTKDKFVPQSEAFSINKGFNLDLMKDEIVRLSTYLDRDSNLSSEYLIRTGVIEQQKLKGRNHVRWNTTVPDEEMAKRICDEINALKNYKPRKKQEEIVEIQEGILEITDADVLQVLEQKAPETPNDIKVVELTMELGIKTLTELIEKQRAENEAAKIQSNKALEYAKTLAEETSKFTEAVKELTAVLRNKK